MAAFGEQSWTCLRTEESVSELMPRGGSACVSFGDFVMVFGGADRTPQSFNDLWKYTLPLPPPPLDEADTKKGKAKTKGDKKEGGKSKGKSNWANIDMGEGQDGEAGDAGEVQGKGGDVPMPRSEHAMVAYGDHLLLFGGVDFIEESVYNDLYALNTQTMEWKYIGESGVEVEKRSSHSLSIVDGPDDEKYLVVFGGAHPEKGPLGDTMYALLPEPERMADPDVFVTWRELEMPTPAAGPGKREMHASVVANGSLYVLGGRCDDLMNDVWVLSASPSSPPSSSSAAVAAADAPAGCPLQWQKAPELTLPFGACAHAAVALPYPPSSSSSSSTSRNPSSNTTIVIVGGCRGESLASGIDISNQLTSIDLSPTGIPLGGWTTVDVGTGAGAGTGALPSRFSARCCATGAGTGAGETGQTQTVFMFGGVDGENDYADTWLIQRKTAPAPAPAIEAEEDAKA